MAPRAEEWHDKLARNLMAATPARAPSEGAASIEIAFGEARSAIAYALELARAHRLPATGRVAGDDVWLQLGEGQMRVTLNRRDNYMVLDLHVPGRSTSRHEETRVTWRDGALVDGQGAKVDPKAASRAMIDVIVAEWSSRPLNERAISSAPPPDLDDEPTKT
jgi:hypothetical protein